MSRAPRSLLALAVLLAAQAGAAARDRAPLTAALENAPALNALDSPSAAPLPETPPAPAPVAEPPAAGGNPLWAIPLRALAATRQRPLFSASRRPPVPVIAAAPAPEPTAMPIAVKPAASEPPPLILMGTVVSAEKRVAVLFNQTTRQVKQVREGEEESGWRVRLVSPRSAVVEKDTRSVTLDLPSPADEPAAGDTPDAAPPPAAPPPAAGPFRHRPSRPSVQ